jgi:hypothetical protein
MKTFDFMRSTKSDLLSQIGVNSINVILSKFLLKATTVITRTGRQKKKRPKLRHCTTAAAVVAYF